MWTRLAWLALLLATGAAAQDLAPQATKPRNVLLLTADDLSRGSVGAFGGRLEGATPNLDALAREGMRFWHAHVAVAICQPCRATIMTGRYPPRNGALGFDPIRAGVPTLPETLRAAGYLTGVFGKTNHTLPSRKDAFDVAVPQKDLGNGRSPERYRAEAAAFFARAKADGKPFFLNANTHDPHRPFATRAYAPGDVPVPGFLPDLPDVREELARYFTSVRRGDAVIGAILAALDDADLRATTIVVFLSDHGISVPFAKTNCWRESTHTPLIVRWPGAVEPGSVDRQHVVSSVDLAPTILDALGLEGLADADGRSFAPILKGDTQDDRDWTFTQINTTSAKKAFPMRAVVGRRFGYIWNAWADGTTRMQNEAMAGLTFQAMQRAAADDPAIAARVQHYLLRTPEELYDFEADPDSLANLAGTETSAERVAELRGLLRMHLAATSDPQRAAYEAFLRAK